VSFSQTADNFQQFIIDNNLVDVLELDVCKGFIIALAAANYDISSFDIANMLFDDEQIYINHPKQQQINHYLMELKNKAYSCLINEDIDDLIGDDISESLCAGLVAGIFFVLEKENASEELVVEATKLMTPIMFASNLFVFDKNSDLAQIANNEQDANALIAEVPNAIIDLFLLFNTDNI